MRYFLAVRASVAVVGLLAAGAPFAARAAEPQAVQSAATEKEADRLWAQSWPEVAHAYIAWKETFHPFLGYSKTYPSSLEMAGRRVTEAMYAGAPALGTLRQSYLSESGEAKTRTLHKPAAEVQAAVRCLPDLAAGQYGWLHAGTIGQVVDADELTLGHLQPINNVELEQEMEKYQKLISQDTNAFYAKVEATPYEYLRARNTNRWRVDQVYQAVQNEASNWWFAERLKKARAQSGWYGFNVHVIGVKTDQLKPGGTWPAGDKGIQLAVFEVSGRTAYAVPTSVLEKGLSEAQVVALLASHGLSQADFLGLVKEAQKKDAKNWLALAVVEIEKRKRPQAPAPAPEPTVAPQPAADGPAATKPDLPFGDRRLDVELE